ncbi:MAG: hypothetical protein RL414_336 [Actinomycetota bacterium]
MIRVALAELRKLKRPSLTATIFLIVAALSTLFTSLVFLRMQGREGVSTREIITKFDGGYYTFGLIGLFLSLIALTLFASSSANEYTYGTLRNILVRQPSRMKVLAGKFIATAGYAIVLVTVAAILNIALSYALSGHAKVDTAAWSSAKAIHGFLNLFGNTTLSIMCYGVVGMSMGLILKNPMSAISISLLWFMVLENVLGAVLSSATQWMPGSAFQSLMGGGFHEFTYTRSLVLSGAYLLLFGGSAAYLFKRRDVAN